MVVDAIQAASRPPQAANQLAVQPATGSGHRRGRAAAATAASSNTAQNSGGRRRMSCRFKESVPEKPWIWTLRMSLQADSKFSTAVRTLADFTVSEAVRLKGISTQPSRNKDGPTVKALESWIQQKTGRRGRPVTQPKRQRQR